MVCCKCKDYEWFNIFFGVTVFLMILLESRDQCIALFNDLEWYRALAVTLGGITVAATVGVVSFLSAQWIIRHIVAVILTIGALWAYSLTM